MSTTGADFYRLLALITLMAIKLQMFCGETCQVHMKVTETTDNQRKTIVNSWVRCLENNQLVITSGFPTKMIENTTTVLETQYFCCCLLHFINSYLGIYFKTKQNKKEKKGRWKKEGP